MGYIRAIWDYEALQTWTLFGNMLDDDDEDDEDEL